MEFFDDIILGSWFMWCCFALTNVIGCPLEGAVEVLVLSLGGLQVGFCTPANHHLQPEDKENGQHVNRRLSVNLNLVNHATEFLSFLFMITLKICPLNLMIRKLTFLVCSPGFQAVDT